MCCRWLLAVRLAAEAVISICYRVRASHYVPSRCSSCIEREHAGTYAGLASVVESNENLLKSIVDQLSSTGRQIEVPITALP